MRLKHVPLQCATCAQQILIKGEASQLVPFRQHYDGVYTVDVYEFLKALRLARGHFQHIK